MFKKNNIIYLLIILLFSSPLYSQVPFGFKGMKAGSSFSNFYKTNSEFKRSYLFGVFGNKQLLDNASLSWEAIFSTKGGIIVNTPLLINISSSNESVYTYDIHCLLLYLEIPIYLKVSFPLKNKVTFFITSGPVFSFARKDLSSLENRKYLSTVEEYFDDRTKIQKDIKYSLDYYSSNQLDKSLRLGFNWGIGLNYKRFSIESRLNILNQDLGYLDKIYFVGLRTYTIQSILSVNLFDHSRSK